MKKEENINITTLSDSYKLNHWNQYLEFVQNVFSYYESRNGAKYPKTVFVGLQYILKKYLTGVVITQEDIEEGEEFALAHFGSRKKFNRQGWEYILNECGGKLPIRIKAVPEGTPVDISNVMMTIEVIDDTYDGFILKFLTNFFETILTHVWFPSNVATIGYFMKIKMLKALRKTCETEEIVQSVIPFMLHDFGMRGTECFESSGFGGFGHFSNFMGTDTTSALYVARDYYNTDGFKNIAYSVSATEHSVMTQLGKEGEEIVLDNLLDEYPDGILSVVADSYNIERFVDVYLRKRKDRILNRKPNDLGHCKFVVRPDSLRNEGDTPEAQMVWLSERLWDIFGGTFNSKGYKVLNPKVGLIWGDGIGPDGILKILDAVIDAGFSVEHLVFGMGGGLLQKHNRDTQRNAFKCSAQKHNDVWVDIQKNPLDQTKKSKAGRLELYRTNKGYYFTANELNKYDNAQPQLVLVYEHGDMIKEYTLDEIRQNTGL